LNPYNQREKKNTKRKNRIRFVLFEFRKEVKQKMISVKKLATVGAAGGLLLASTMPAFAFGGHHGGGSSLEQENKNTNVTNTVSASSNTGNNTSSGGHHWWGGGNSITTGDASTYVDVLNKVNKNKVELPSCRCFKKVEQENKNTNVTNTVSASSNTGYNTGKNITTGAASTGVIVTNVVNKNIVKVGP
jgi:hypothetical protein